ncbi:MAG: serine/threonine protein kinase [Pirellulales bacterium]|nr:serine/threonine protein kinase [Pirellulales bacterium]
MDDQQQFDALEAYLARLQSGEKPDRRRFLAEHPELASALDCLEVLERFAPSEAALEDGAAGPSPLEQWGRDFGGYDLIEEIGRGGMGVVYKARQRTLDRVVALKMILAGQLSSPEHLNRFLAEAKTAARLHHPHIVPIHEVGCVHGQHFFAMEYIEGPSLSQRVAEGSLDMNEAVRLLASVARAVAELHRHGIVHRDLKPSNILLDAAGAPFVTDFGLAKVFEADSTLTATGVIAGTPSYMSPEQAAGHSAAVGPASDVYSLGTILYELLTGRPPFREETPLETVLQVVSREPVLPRRLVPKIPRSLELICLKCLAKSPDARYASAEALADDLERFLRGEPLAVQPPNVGTRLWRWTRRQPALALRLAAFAVFYLVGLTNYLTGGIDLAFHLKMLSIVGVWVLASIGLQQCLDSRRWSIPARFGWGTIDAVLLLAVLLVADGAASPLVVGYPLLIVGSGLWYRVRFVWFMTVLSLISYGLLVLDFYYRRPELASRLDPYWDRHLIFAVALVVQGAAVAYLVHRLRTLSTYYGGAK